VGLSKGKVEILASRLRHWNLLEGNINISIYRRRKKKLTSFFTMQDNLVACVNINCLMEALSINYNSEEWRLFIDSSSVSLKAVFLHVGKELPSVPAGYSVHVKEFYENIQLYSKPSSTVAFSGRFVVT
jgi:hypothetical protein